MFSKLALLPCLASALRLSDEGGNNVIFEETGELDVSVGHTMNSDFHTRSIKGAPAGGGDAVNGTNAWPDSWMVAHEHGHFIAHVLDEAKLFELVHAKSDGYTAVTPALPEYNIPAAKMHHAIPGWAANGPEDAKTVTSFPSYLALASSWDKDMVYDVAYAVAEEFKSKGANVMLGPAVNIHRATQHDEEFDSLSGEDPTLGSVLVRSWILASQTHGIASVPKFLGKAEQNSVHFENATANMTSWDIFYPPFETAIDCGASGVMCASHEVNGLWSCRDKEMLERDLKGIMNFHGMVMSDSGTAREYFEYASAFEKGLDLAVNEPEIITRSEHMVKGMRKAATRVVASLWHMHFESGGQGCQPPDCKAALASMATTDAHKDVAKRAAGSAVTLLKNDGLLPLSKATTPKVAVMGPAADKTLGDRGLFETPYHALKAAAAEVGITMSKDPSGADACLVMARSAQLDSKWQLDPASLKAIDGALKVCSQTAVFMEVSGAVLTPWREQVNAIASVFWDGEETAMAWAATLLGGFSPSGKLPISFPDFTEDVPDWWNEAQPSYWDPPATFAYPFGHGLSYATFSYGEIKQKPLCHFALCVMVTVTNSNKKYSGAEVVQVYFKFAEAAHPTVLRAFYKTKVLAPGESEKVFFPFTFRDISLYQDAEGSASAEKSWVLQESVDILIGSSSKDIRQKATMYPKFA